ncbi:sulfatase-like hydrolase/transferase [Haloferax chudinovii]|uniref:Sulfatase-like hydrolase/transferase n=1 Tax=Haloferax chudinovii TaxID=1109010 RepID=A0ABD5XMS9_9EURY
MPDHPNIAVVVLDTLRYDTFDEFFDWIPGTSFTNAYSTSHWTVPAHGSLFTGLYPSEVGVHSQSLSLDCDEPTIAEELHGSGYYTRKYTANLNIHLWDGWDRGFEKNIGPDELVSYYDTDTLDFSKFLSQSDGSGLSLYLSAISECIKGEHSTIYSLLDGTRRYFESKKRGGAKSVLRQLEDETFDDREFIFINLMDVHVPYYPPKEYRTLSKEVSTNNWEPFVGDISNLSDAKIAYNDAASYLSDMYKKIFSKLNEDFDYILTLSDHGEMLGEFDMIDHTYGVYPQLSHIPLVISGGDVTESTIDVPVSILDVHATIADLAGIECQTHGQILLNDPQAKNRLVEYHGFLPWLKERFVEKGVPEETYEELNQPLHACVNKDGNYSFETHSDGLIVEDGLQHQEARRNIDSLVSQLTVREVSTDNSSVEDPVMDRLEDLGYA